MSDLTPIAPKLCKLIPRLASDQDGEVVATVRAIQRTLAAAGMDLHDLAVLIDPPPRLSPPSPPSPRRPAPAAQPTDSQPASLIAFIVHAEHGVELTNRETEFVLNLEALIRWRGGRLSLSEKQRAWLEAIHARCRRGFDGGAHR